MAILADSGGAASTNTTALDPFAPKQPNETNAQYMARVTAAYKAQPQPQLTPQQEAAGATVQFVRTGAAGEGQYKIVYPIGVGFDPATGQPTGTTSTVSTNSKVSGTGDSSSDPFLFEGKPYTGKLGFFTYRNGVKIANVDGSPLNSTPSATTTDTAKKAAGQSAYDLLFSQFSQYGLGSLIEPLKTYIQDGLSLSEFTLKLRDTPQYQKRFAANAARINNGLAALDEATYIGLEDQYQDVMRRYGLPDSYYSQVVDPATGMKTQPGFEKFIAGDVSARELEDRIMTAQKRVINAEPSVTQALKQFYPDITNGDILAYTLDPKNAIENIKRKVTAAEIGGAALSQGLATSAAGAEELAGYGVTKQQAQQGYQTIGEMLPTASKLADIYAKQGLGGYNQATAEQEVFGTAGAATAAQKRKKLTQLEQASFSGSAGTSQGALGRERAGQF